MRARCPRLAGGATVVARAEAAAKNARKRSGRKRKRSGIVDLQAGEALRPARTRTARGNNFMRTACQPAATALRAAALQTAALQASFRARVLLTGTFASLPRRAGSRR